MTTTLLRISPDQATRPLFIGVDVGGTSIKMGLVDDQGRSAAKVSIPTEALKGPQDAVQRIATRMQQMLDEEEIDAGEIAAVGLGTPGTMDIPAGMLIDPPNLPGWDHFPIRDRLAEACGKPVSFANDAGAAAYGEFWVGSGKEFHSIVLLTLGTGVGGGIIIGGMSIDGENSHGSECGHIIIDCSDTARVCGCGHRGHLEAYASATGLIKRAHEALQANDSSAVKTRVDAGEQLTPLLLAEEAEKGDSFALDLVMETAMYLGVGAVSLMHTIDPGAVILGGAMTFGGRDSQLGRRFLERIRQEVRQRAFETLVQRTVIDFASIGGDAGYIGAAGIARSAYHKKSDQESR